MCEYGGQMMTCSDAWAQYERDMQNYNNQNSGGSGNQSGAGPSPSSTGSPSTSGGKHLGTLVALAEAQATAGEAYEAAYAYWNDLSWPERNVAHAEYQWLIELQERARANPSDPYGPLGQSQAQQSEATESVESTPVATEAEVRYERDGYQVRRLSLKADGLLTFRVKTELKKGSMVIVETRGWDIQESAWSSDQEVVTVEGRGIANVDVQVGPYQYVYIKNSNDKTLVRITTA